MSRRAPLPGASELFRLTSSSNALELTVPNEPREAEPEPAPEPPRRLVRGAKAARSSTPRQKHDAKITVYVSGDELLAMEHARLTLRGGHGLVVDRGRLVREAVAVLLADFDEFGEDSVLVHRLRAAGSDDAAESGAGG
ncbi:cobyrinic acid a,c-diamide synthase [Amycolatopsis sp. 195334CR]|uniref:cobyrinic acid a,c-diamide synthase n=1 Tax=Amycolatopsis sp. 195334CR TaxID=2814588 RepID=UPI001A8E4118|nr:cobyrinic acid a,c-diamide synthase [Amycolatopsis sp. 195334CR]MBN6038688.1 cobyrinic acid a,c-diamide synthase [Amycolatopsis sp. 195334CR]